MTSGGPYQGKNPISRRKESATDDGAVPPVKSVSVVHADDAKARKPPKELADIDEDFFNEIYPLINRSQPRSEGKRCEHLIEDARQNLAVDVRTKQKTYDYLYKAKGNKKWLRSRVRICLTQRCDDLYRKSRKFTRPRDKDVVQYDLYAIAKVRAERDQVIDRRRLYTDETVLMMRRIVERGILHQVTGKRTRRRILAFVK